MIADVRKNYFDKNIVNIYYILILAILAGARFWGNGPDYFDYFINYGSYWGNVNYRREVEPYYKIFRLFNDVFFSSSMFTLYFFNALFALSIKLVAYKYLCKNYQNFLLCLIFYFFTFFFLHDYVQIRASLAIALFFWSLRDIAEKKTLHFFIKACIAICCHYSAIAMLPFYFFCKIFNNKKVLLVTVICGFFFAIIVATKSGFIKKIADLIYAAQIATGINKSGPESEWLSPFNFKYLAMLGLFVFLYHTIKKNDKIDMLLYQSFAFGLCFFYYLNSLRLSVVSVRFAEFYTCVFIIILANNWKKIRIKEKAIIFCFCLVFVLFYSYATLKTTGIL